MKTVGIIAEYNPFHNGHAYHIAETKKRTKADYIVVVMSGNFVQRGAPALLDKYTRTRMALDAGADVVIELPAVAALSSAESFACGGVTLLASLGVVTDISFGAEIRNAEDIAFLEAAAALFAKEPAGYRELLAAGLKKGCSFPTARAEAAIGYLSAQDYPVSGREDLLSGPNNILAVEYLKTIRRCHYDLAPCLISRTGSAYHELDMQADFPSASAIRRYLLRESGQPAHDPTVRQNPAAGPAAPGSPNKTFPASDLLRRAVPDSVFRVLADPETKNRFLREDDFSSLLFYALTEHADDADSFGEKNRELALRLQNQMENYVSWSQFAALLKTKNRTYAAVSRFLAHILLGIRQEDFAQAAECRFAPYARILGFQKSAAPLLKQIHEKSSLPVITNLAAGQDALTPAGRRFLTLDVRACELYNYVLLTKTGEKIKNEYRQPLICL